jgi:hypothetical protein
MNTLSIVGLGKVAIYPCNSEQTVEELMASLKGSNVRLLLPYAVCYLRNQYEPVEVSGALFMPNRDVIDLYSGGALDNMKEVILSSLVISSPEYIPSDFSLA